MDNKLLQKDIEAIKSAGGSDQDVLNYLKDNGVQYSEQQSTQENIQQPNDGRVTLQDLEQHPGISVLRELFQPVSKSVAGTTLGQEYDKRFGTLAFQTAGQDPLSQTGAFAQTFIQGLAADVADQAQTPANYLGAGLVKGVGGALGKTAAGKAVGRFVGQNIKDVTPRQIWRRIINKEGLEDKVQSIRWQKQDLRSQSEKDINVIKKNTNDNNNKLVKEIKDTNTQLTSEIQDEAIKVQEALPRYFRNNSTAYGEKLEIITDDLAKSGQPFLRNEADDILTRTLSELDDSGITEGMPRNIIQKLKSKYEVNALEPEKGLDEVKLKDFISDMRKVSKALSHQVKSGVRFSSEDIADVILKKNFGEFAATRVPEFSVLQKQYAPVIQVMKQAGKLFKPYAGDFTNINGATAVLKRIALGKATPQELELVKMIQDGSCFSKGLGDITTKIKTTGKTIADKGELIKLNKINSKKSIEDINKVITEGKENLTSKEREILTQLIRKKNIRTIRNRALKIGASIVGAGGVYSGIKKFSN